jgi:trigger factor
VSITKEITRLEKSNVKLKLTIPKEEALSQYQELLKDYAKNAQIPGFRRGKAPQEVLIRKFGEALKGEARNKIIEKTIGEVFADESLPRNERPLPYAYPQMEEPPKLDFDEDLSFSLVYDVLPEVHIAQWKGLEVEIPEVSVTEQDLARELEEVRERNSFVLDRDDDAQAQRGDVVTVNYGELGEDGEILTDSQRDDFVFTLGSQSNIYHFDDDITGMKKGETREVTKAYPEDEALPDLAGKTVKLRITLTALKEKKLPDLDDDLAQDVDEKYHTLDDLKNSIRERLEKSLALRIKDIKINKLLEKIMENTPVTLPESMVRVELDGRLRTMARRFGTDLEGLLRMMAQTGADPDEIEKNWRLSTEKGLHSRLIVETLMDELHIEADDAEVGRELEKIAVDTGKPLEEVERQYGEGKAAEYVKDSIRESKLFDLLLAENTIKTGSRTNYLDVMGNNE